MMRLYYQPNTADGEETLLPEDGLLSELSTGSVSNNTVHSSYIREKTNPVSKQYMVHYDDQMHSMLK